MAHMLHCVISNWWLLRFALLLNLQCSVHNRSLFAGVAGWVSASLSAIGPEIALSGVPSRPTLAIVLSSLHWLLGLLG